MTDKIKNELKKFMRARKHLVWYAADPEDLPVESIIENTLNSGDCDEVPKFIIITGT